MLKNAGAKYGTLLSLYLAQSIPMSFFSTVMPVIMRMEGYSLTSIGLIQLIKLPWIAKFLWAPVVDRTGASVRGHKKWIIASEIFYAVVILGIGFLSLEVDFKLIVGLMLIAFTASATQDIATDAFAILVLKEKERSIGNSMQSAGSFLGTLTGSGILMIIYYYWGWQLLLVGLAGFVLIATIPLFFYKGKHQVKETERHEWLDINKLFKIRKFKRLPDSLNILITYSIGIFQMFYCYLKIFIDFVKLKGNGRRILLLTTFYSGIIGILTMIKPWMVDLGYNVKEIGILSGIHGAAFGAAAALLAGLVIKKGGKRNSIRLFAFFGLLASTYFTYLTYQDVVKFYQIVIGIALIWAAYGMSSVIIYTISMDNVRPGREGTDFTFQIVITHLSSLIIAVSSGRIADLITYKGLFRIEFIITILVLIAVPLLYKDINRSEKQ